MDTKTDLDLVEDILHKAIQMKVNYELDDHYYRGTWDGFIRCMLYMTRNHKYKPTNLAIKCAYDYSLEYYEHYPEIEDYSYYVFEELHRRATTTW